MIERKKEMEPGHPSTPVEPTPSTPPTPTPPQLTPFFRLAPRREALIAEVNQWKGTPFRREAAGDARKGVGADCVSFVEQALVNVGAIRPINWPRYVCFGGGDAMLLLLLTTMRSLPGFVEIWKAQPGGPYPPLMAGDIFVRSIEHPKTKLVDYHHLALFMGDNTLIHMRQRKGLSKANIFDARALKKLQSIFRVHEPAT